MTNKSKKLVYGKGVKGDSISCMNGKLSKPYTTWRNMLERCYSQNYHLRKPTYINCSVCKEWLYYPTFKEWFDENYVEGWQLDKDLLVNGNKIYGPNTCIFVPTQINTLFNGHDRARGEYPVGVSYNKRDGKLQAHIRIDGKQQHLGCFEDAEEAHKAYLIAKKANVIRMAEVWKDKIPSKLYEALIIMAHIQ